MLNTNQVICTVDRKQKFEAEFDVRIGRGFFTGDGNKRADMPLGVIPIDSIFSPVIRVKYSVENTLDDLAWHRSPIQLNVRKMSAVEVIEQIRALPEEERAKVVRFVIEHEESWIPAEFREAMDEAAQGKMVNMERVMAGEKPPGA